MSERTGILERQTTGGHAEVSMAAVETRDLVKVFASRKSPVRALDGLSISVPEGTVLGLLGPNGAGKTTAVRALATLLPFDSGSASVLGHDVQAEPDVVRRSIGLSGQFSAVDENLTGKENLWLFGRLYGLPTSLARSRAGDLLELFDLADAADRVAKTYSGGMKRRLDLAGALVASPRVLFLDEPTTGLDPRSRLDLWDVIRERVSAGTTLLLTTQYLEEADALASRIAVIDTGHLIAEGTSDELKAQVGGERVEVVVHDPRRLAAAQQALAALASGETAVNEHTRRVSAPVRGGSTVLVAVIRELDALGIAIDDIALRRPTLDDVFLSLTGHAAERASAAADEPKDRRGDRERDRVEPR
ncbi:MAG: ATP-binding cassette domain-containing protein [Nocardioidaceae bacterium]